jgi:hypothetical protein
MTTPITDLKTGDKVDVWAHNMPKGSGLSYPSFEGVLLEYAGCSEGWDVVDVLRTLPDGSNDVVSIYCFSINRGFRYKWFKDAPPSYWL